jgi:ATP-dependent DNA helicase RecQ
MAAFESDASSSDAAPPAPAAPTAPAPASPPRAGGSAPHDASTARFRAGDAVRVRRYGAGIVTEATADAVTVDFGGKQRRCFHPDFVRPGRAAAVATAVA